MALGAAMFIRGDGGFFRRNNLYIPTEDWHIATDFNEIWDRHVHNEWSLPVPPKTRAKTILWERVPRVIAAAKKNMYDEWPVPVPDDEFWNLTAGWLTYGYMLARQRYRRYDVGLLADLFHRIMVDCDKVLKHAQEGMTCFVRVELKNYTAKVNVEQEGIPE